MTWVAVAVGGSALIGAGSSYLGSKKQADAAKNAAGISERQFDITNAQQQPFIQSGYNANNALNYLMGFGGGGGGTPSAAPTASPSYAPTAGGGIKKTLGNMLSPTTAATGLIDPLGATFRGVSGTPTNLRGMLDPLGVFGGGGGDTEAFNKGPRPTDTGGTRFKPSDLVRLKGQGMSIDQIAQQGWLSPMEHEDELNYLKQSGFSPEDIQRLQYGAQPTEGGASGAQGADGAPISGLDSGYLTHQFNSEDFFKNIDPSYGWRVQQGTQGLQNSAAAQSGALSGAALKDLLGYNQDMASTEYGNAFNRYTTQQNNIFSRLSTLAGLGQNAAAGVGAQGTALAGQAGQAVQNAGTAAGAGIVGAGNALSNAGSNYWLSKMAGGP